MNLVVNPLPGSSIGDDTTVTQCCKMARYLGLYYTQRMDEFADAQFALLLNQHQAAEACVIGQKLKKLAALHFHAAIIYGIPYIRSTTCILVAASDRGFLNVHFRLPPQQVDATQALNLSASVSIFNV